VEIIPNKLGSFYICAECERMWKVSNPLDPEFVIDYCDFMEERGLAAVWSNLREIKRMGS